MKKVILTSFMALMLFGGMNAFAQTGAKPTTTKGNAKTKPVPANASVAQKKKAQAKAGLTLQQLQKDHGFPVLVNTGNPEADQKKYKAAKDEWIRKNPDLYKQMNVTSEASNQAQLLKQQKASVTKK